MLVDVYSAVQERVFWPGPAVLDGEIQVQVKHSALVGGRPMAYVKMPSGNTCWVGIGRLREMP